MPRVKALKVVSPEQWLVFVSPVRSEICEVLRLMGPCSIAQIAEVLDRPADALYAHLELLQSAGFVRDAGRRKGRRHTEQLFDVVAEDFTIDFKDATGSAENQAVVATAQSYLKAMARAVRDSAAAGELQFAPATRNISINYELSWLTHEKYQEVRALIRRLKRLMDEGKKRREGRLYMTLAIACPVTRKRGSARAAGKAASSRPAEAAKGPNPARVVKPKETRSNPRARRATPPAV